MEFTSYLFLAIRELAFGIVIPMFVFFYSAFKLAEKYPKYETLILCLGIILYALLRYPMSYLFALLLRG